MVDAGKLKVTDSVISFFPESLPSDVSANLKAMTVHHLLSMNTGNETEPAFRGDATKTWVQNWLAHPVPHAPGSHFLYNTGATYMLGAIVHKITGETLVQFLKPRLFDPLGITDYDWEESPQGLNTAGYGLRVSTESIARFGQLYLQKGNWKGKQLISESWVEEATKNKDLRKTMTAIGAKVMVINSGAASRASIAATALSANIASSCPNTMRFLPSTAKVGTWVSLCRLPGTPSFLLSKKMP
ncbi:MAG: serine hydrolase [Saprospiraceae bacterium]|nr:serine hydrolase [Saprospiraceae bacterium]